MAVVECIPNISEGRRRETIDAVVSAVRESAPVRVLDVSSDASHNRAVITLAGDPDTLKAAVPALYAAAIPRIDLRTHRGEHPRLGAVDVVPFVPIEGVTMDDCVALARDVGADVAARFGLPVFLYEAAASRPARVNLPDIRRGEFEGLGAKLSQPEWRPDFGPAAPHPTAGATVIGARMPLIAFNVNLATDRLDVAKAIARAVRFSSGGLPFVKALGVPLHDRGTVQVSMNLTNFRETPITRAFDAVKAEAARHGVAIAESEIVGLVPAAAIPGDAVDALQLARFSPDQILEQRLRKEA